MGSELDSHVELPVNGTRGGILIVWSRAIVQAITTRVDNFSASILFQSTGGHLWWFTGVYGPQDDAQKLLFLEEMRAVRAACAGPWVIVGVLI